MTLWYFIFKMDIHRNIIQVSSSGAMLLILILHLCQRCVFSQGPEGFFNASSYVSIPHLFDVRGRTSFSFRSCSSGQILYQEGITGDFINITLLPSGTIDFNWQVNRHPSSVTAGSGLIDNRWHNVDILHRLGSVTLTVSRDSVLVANSSYHGDLFDLRLESSSSLLTVGRGITGCLLQGAGVLLSDPSAYSYEVDWGTCPLPAKDTCEGYGEDPCFSEPCHKFSRCISLPNGYQCDCTRRYSGVNCDIDSGPLCDKAHCENGGTCQEDPSGNFTTCACSPLYTGVYCETMVDNNFCDHMPCRHGGTCNINHFRNGYVCTCPQGFAGANCELNIDECQSSPCQNNGSCTDEINSYTCDCSQTGYRGRNCEENINECVESNPCYTGSQCFDRYGGYLCDCPPGFGGKNCDQEVNECDSAPCQNKGTCSDNLNGYLCHCVSGFAGINCEENIDDCIGVFCPSNSHCVDGVGSFSCVCDLGYEGAVPHCQEINECADMPCLNGGSCQDYLNRFLCTCPDGFNGTLCEINIDECEGNPCNNGATCIDGAGKYSCECAVGYSGINCEIDVNDCDPNPCQNNANCTDLVNDYLCACSPGWEGKTCAENHNECESLPCMHGQCIDSLNNFTCNCYPGYTGLVCETDINECDSSPCFNSGTCSDLVNDYSCQCPQNFMGKSCEEVYNACGSEPCQNGGTCQTNIPSHEYSCVCPLGYLGDNCETDIDDCDGVICPNGEVCADLRNSFQCRCPEGFTGDNCATNIDECIGNPCINGTCVDGIGAFRCQCPPGITGHLCDSDIDECVSSSPCRHGICQNMFGSFLCYCTPGFTGTLCDIEFNECLSTPCRNGATCNDLVNDYSCNCVPGYAGRNCEVDIDECSSDPCQNGATCSNLVDRYECACVPGFSGLNCEINIDECASMPCFNGGACIDLINQFFCNCSDTGFTGSFCESNIDDCSPNLCQNGASCEDMVKDYHCYCYDGYNGKNCENDIEDCVSSPCMNSGLCLENSNQTLYEINYLGFYPSFSYNLASGYRCVCASGFTGENCETNIDDCENHSCHNGICIDAINDYYCACHLGYDGQFCSRDINECQLLEPCENGATCVDLVADYRCDCQSSFGGKNCQTKLIGCMDVQCLNGATCIPLLDDNGDHAHVCQCTDGYHGKSCGISTTVSFDTGASLTFKMDNDVSSAFSLEFRFRTTLPDGLISTGYTANNMLQYMVYLWNGALKMDVYVGTQRVVQLFSKKGLNDAHWKSVSLSFHPEEVSLNASDWALQKRLQIPGPLNFTVQFGASKNEPGFIGCAQDIRLNGQMIIPNVNGLLKGAVEGCERKEQCEGSPCHQGTCKDKWVSYECVCSRPYFGTTCLYSYEAATFGYRNQPSRAELLLSEDARSALAANVAISLFLQTRNESGLIYYLGSALGNISNCTLGNNTFVVSRLVHGQLQVILKQQNGNIIELTHTQRMDDGQTYFIQVDMNDSALTVRVNDSAQSAALFGSSVCLEALYIGSVPSPARHKRQAPTNKIDLLLLEDLVFFKGIMQDFRVNDQEVVFYELAASEDTGFPKVLGQAVLSDSVREGSISDDPCALLQPCRNGALCTDIWNEYICICPEDYRGKNCEERKPCADNTCPFDSECRNLDVGYECVASAAFDGKQNGVLYEVNNTNYNFLNVSFSFRSRDSGTILYVGSNPFSEHFLHIEIVSGTLEVKWDLGPQHQNAAYHKTVSQKLLDNQGEWQDVQIWFDGNLVHLKVGNNSENLSEDNYFVGLNQLLNSGASVYVGYKPDFSFFKGCLSDVRIGGVLLTFLEESFSSGNPFRIARKTLSIGCQLCWVDDCLHGSCLNQTDSYNCQCLTGYEGQHCEVDMCASKNPCENGGTCFHVEEGLACSCFDQFTGNHCTDLNLCRNSPCMHGGTCIQRNNEFICVCGPNYKGAKCEEPTVLSCSDVDCLHGTCEYANIDSFIQFSCRCFEGYEDTYCNSTKDFCSPNPCLHGGRCDLIEEPDFATFRCSCPTGFAGAHCEENVNECVGNPCDRGQCIDLIGNFSCACYPGYKGRLCSERITHCHDAESVCNRGNCTDRTGGGYECQCPPRFIGPHCNIMDECQTSTCNHQGLCQPLHDKYEVMFLYDCKCYDGFSGEDCLEEISRGGDDSNLIIIILIPVLSLFLLCILIGLVIFLRIAKKKRATRGTYSPSRQEMFGSRVEMNHVMKPPPEERLI